MPMVYQTGRGEMLHPRLSGYMGAVGDPAADAKNKAKKNLENVGISSPDMIQFINSVSSFVCDRKKKTGRYPKALEITSLVASNIGKFNLSNLTGIQKTMVAVEFAALAKNLKDRDVCGIIGTITDPVNTTPPPPKSDNTNLLLVGGAVLLLGGAYYMSQG